MKEVLGDKVRKVIAILRVDKFAVHQLEEFDGRKLTSATKEGLGLDDEVFKTVIRVGIQHVPEVECCTYAQ